VAVGRALAWLVDAAPETLEPTVARAQKTAAFNMTILSQLLGTPLQPDGDSQTSNRRSMLLNAGLFGDFRLSTLICWRSTRISASSRALDRNSPVSAHPSSKRKSIIVHEHHPIRPSAPPVWGFRQGHPLSCTVALRLQADHPISWGLTPGAACLRSRD